MPMLTFRGWGGGVNKRLPPDQISDTEVVTAENVELDLRSNLRTRPGVVDTSEDATGMDSRITSIAYYEKSDGTDAVFATEAADVRRWDDTSDWPALSQSAVVGEEPCGQASCILPANKTWYWTVFNDKLIGVNGDTTGGTTTNTVLVDSTSASPVMKKLSTDSAQPKFKYIEVANNRLFGVDADTPNQVVASKLGDAEGSDAWSATGIAGFYAANIGGDEGGRITAIKVYQNQLIVFKRRRIYTLLFGSPNTDTAQWEIRQLASNVGCISQNSVQEILGDLIFLSDEGLMSLRRLLSSGGDVTRALLSENVPDLRNVSRSREDYPSAVIPDKSQYLISIPTDTPAENDVTWVMDYSQLSVNGRVAFTKWDGGAAGSSLAQVIDTNGDIRIFIGTELFKGRGHVYRLHNDDSCVSAGSSCFSDVSEAYTTNVVFKSMNFDEPLVRKVIHRWGMEFGTLTDPATLEVFLSLDGNDALTRSWPVSFSGTQSGAIWNEDLWNTGLWATEISTDTDVWQKVSGVRRFQKMQLSVRQDTINQGVLIKTIGTEVSRLTHRKVDDT